MKNNTIQVHRHGGTKPAKSQAKTSRRKSAARPDAAEKIITLLFYSHDDDKTLIQTHFPAAVFNRLQQSAKAAGITLEEVILRAIRQELSGTPTQAAQPAAPVAVEDTISLILLSEPEGSIAHHHLTREQLQALQNRAKLENKTLAELLEIGLDQMLWPRDFLQLELAFGSLKPSIKAATALLMLLAEKTEDRDLETLVSQTVLKLTADASAVSAGFNAPYATLDNAEVAL